MLYADKTLLMQRVRLNLIGVRQQELSFYTANLQSLGVQSALMSGVLYPGIIYIVIPEGKNDTLITAYLCVAAAAFGLNLLVVLNAMLVTLIGPGLALRGPDGAVHRAVEDMLDEYRLAFAIFVLGIIGFHLACFLLCYVIFVWYARAQSCIACPRARPRPRGATLSTGCACPLTSRWRARRRIVAVFSSGVVLIFMVLSWFEFMRVYNRFRVPPSLMITGRFDTDMAIYETTLTAAELRGINHRDVAEQTVRQQVREFLSPVSYARAYLAAHYGPMDAEDDGYLLRSPVRPFNELHRRAERRESSDGTSQQSSSVSDGSTFLYVSNARLPARSPVKAPSRSRSLIGFMRRRDGPGTSDGR
jgi:hypothetical protein